MGDEISEVDLATYINILGLKLNGTDSLLNSLATIARAFSYSGSGVLNVPIFATSTARDAALTSPQNGDMCYVTADGVFYDYQGGGWHARANGSTPNASTTVSGTVQTATQAQIDAGTATTGSTGANLEVMPAQINPYNLTNSKSTPVSADLFTLSDSAASNSLKKISYANLVPAGSGAITGEIRMWSTPTSPTGWLNCSGTAVSRTTYATLFSTICPSLGNPTITIATPAVVTLTNHGLVTGDTVYFTTTGALPTGLSVNTIYYAIYVSSSTFNVSSTYGGAAINTSGSQSGTHTLVRCPYGLGDGSTTFNLPDFRGRTPIGTGTGTATGATLHNLGLAPISGASGEETHTLTVTEMPSHNHTWQTIGGSGGPQGGSGSTQSFNYFQNTGNTGGGGAHNIMQPTTGINFIIKT